MCPDVKALSIIEYGCALFRLASLTATRNVNRSGTTVKFQRDASSWEIQTWFRWPFNVAQRT
jgi:hypothetical protein